MLGAPSGCVMVVVVEEVVMVVVGMVVEGGGVDVSGVQSTEVRASNYWKNWEEMS